MTQPSHHVSESSARIPGRLRPILDSTQLRVKSLRESTTVDELLSKGRRFSRRSLAEAVQSATPAVIAEVKKASPSKGVFRADFDPVALAGAYARAGASAISVVTEPDHFQGQDEWIVLIRDMCDCPILRKDFMLDPIQIAETSALGADAVLLIARLLSLQQIHGLAAAAADAQLEVLFEVHDEADLEKLDGLNPALVGVNARNLDDFTVDCNGFSRLRPMIPQGAVAVAESGIENRDQVLRFVNEGYRAFLVGESLIRSDEPEQHLRSLIGP